MGLPTVSVILPARDAHATVDAAVRSLIAQTRGDFELIAIDDGSVDGTGAVLQALAGEDRRIRVLRTPGIGLVGALNLGLGEVHGRYVARMDADDESLPERFERSVAALEADPSLSGVGTGVEIFRDDRPPSPSLQAYARWLNSLTTPELLFRDRLIESPLCHPSSMLRREAAETAGGWREGDFPEDWELWLRMLEGGHRLSCVPQVLYRWRDHDTRLTRTDARYGRAQHLALRADVIARRFQGRPLVIAGAGEIGVRLARLLVARGAKVSRFIEVNPRKIGQRIHGVPVVAGSDLGAPERGEHLLAAVGLSGAREELRTWLMGLGWLEGRDFTCVA